MKNDDVIAAEYIYIILESVRKDAELSRRRSISNRDIEEKEGRSSD